MKERWRRGPPCGCGLGSANGTPAPWPFRLLASRWSCFRALLDMTLAERLCSERLRRKPTRRQEL